MRYPVARDALISLMTWMTESVYRPYSMIRHKFSRISSETGGSSAAHLMKEFSHASSATATSASSTAGSTTKNGGKSGQTNAVQHYGSSAISTDTDNDGSSANIQQLLEILAESHITSTATGGGHHNSREGNGARCGIAASILAQQVAPLDDIRTLPADLTPMLSTLNHHLSHSPALATKLCRLIRANIAHILTEYGVLNQPQLQATAGTTGAAGTAGVKSTAAALDVLEEPVFPTEDAEMRNKIDLSLKPAIEIVTSVLLPVLSTSRNNVNLTAQVRLP
jgi:hypothetical protein